MEKKKIAAEEIVEEILPLLREYFVAECLSYGRNIQLIFSDGQTVILTVET